METAVASSPVESIDPPRRSRSSLFERRRPLFWFALAFCLGIVLDDLIAPALSGLGGVCVAAFAVAGLVGLKRDGAGRARFAAALALGLAGGALIHALQSRIPASNDISRRTSALPSFVFIEGTIVETTRAATPGGLPSWTVSVEVLGADAAALSPASGRVLLRIPKNDAPVDDLGEGDRVRLCARVEAPPDVTLPEGFDYGAYLSRSGVRRTGTAMTDSVVKIAGAAWYRPDLVLRRWSATLAARIEEAFPSDDAGRSRTALMNALLFGRRERLDPADRESFSISGTAHLLAISGLQIQFFAVALFWLAGVAGISRRRAAWGVLIASCAYCALAGADAPIMRATVMIVLYLAALLLWREPDPLSVLGASALVILMLSPAQLFSVGFQLSFAAVLALVALGPVLNDAWENRLAGPYTIPVVKPPPWTLPWRTRMLTRLRRTLFVSLVATLGTAPVVAWHMGRVSLLGLALNIVCVPMGSVCMLLGIAALILGVVSTAAASVFVLLGGLCIAFLQSVNALAAQAPITALDVPKPAAAALLAYATVLGAAWIFRAKGVTLWRISAAFGVCLALLLSGLIFRDAPETSSVTVLDLPRGRATLIESPNGGAALIDAGGPEQGLRLAEMLRRKGVHRLSLMVLTADDPDAIGGALDLLKRVPASQVLMPRSGGASSQRRELEAFLEAHNIGSATTTRADDAEAGLTTLRGPGDVRWEVCDDNPSGVPAPKAEAGLAVRVELPGRSLLFADLRSSAAAQRLLARLGTRVQADVLCLSCAGQHWPPECAQFIRQSGCRALIANAGDSDGISGADLSELTDTAHVRLLAPQKDGSLRIDADTGIAAGPAIESFRNGAWKPVE